MSKGENSELQKIWRYACFQLCPHDGCLMYAGLLGGPVALILINGCCVHKMQNAHERWRQRMDVVRKQRVTSFGVRVYVVVYNKQANPTSKCSSVPQEETTHTVFEQVILYVNNYDAAGYPWMYGCKASGSPTYIRKCVGVCLYSISVHV